MLWAKILVPVLMVLGGTAAAAVALVGADESTAGPSQVWIDGPEPGQVIAPGTIAVSAHATAEAGISALELLVDDDVVATDDDLEQTERLVFASFEWDATQSGEHELVVRQVGGTGDRSDPRFVVISDDERDATPTTSTTTTTEPGETTTTSSTTTTSTTEPGETTTVPPEVTTTTAPPFGTPTTTPPATTQPVDPVAIDSAVLVSPYGDYRLYVGACSYVVEVQARIRNADYASAIVQGTGSEVAMTKSGSSSWTATLTSGSLWSASDVGVHTVVVLAGRGDEVVDRQLGTVDIRLNCPKD